MYLCNYLYFDSNQTDIMEEKTILYGYKMTHDTGFAPNPYHGVLTLATCKPRIRKYTKEGYWISGWTSNEVYDKDYNKHSFTDSNQKLIYLAKVSKVLSFKDYWEKYPLKKQPEKSIIEDGKECFKSCGNVLITKSDDIAFCGDNIYEPDANDTFGFKQHENPHHGEKEKERDISGEHVLVCEEFYYFGVENAIPIEKKGVVHRWKRFPFDKGKEIIDFVKEHYTK